MNTSFRVENRPLPRLEVGLESTHLYSAPSGISSAPTSWVGARKNSGGLCQLVGNCIRRICDFFARLLGCSPSENAFKPLPPMPINDPAPSLPRAVRIDPLQGRRAPLPRSEFERLSALYHACVDGNLNALNDELADGQSPVNTPFLGGSPLHNAIQNGHLAIVQRLLEVDGLDLTRIDMHGRTPLHLACELTNIAMMRALLTAGAPTDTGNVDGQPPFHLACERNREEVVAEWIRAGGPVDTRNALGQTALHCACDLGHENIARLLLNANCPLDATDNHGDTALHFACRSRHLGILQLLLNAHAPLHVTNSAGLTPLHVACCNRIPTEGLRVLIQAGAPVNINSRMPYFTPLYCLLDPRNERLSHRRTESSETAFSPEEILERVNILLEAGADPSATFLRGRISILNTAQNHHRENAALIQRLEQAIAV